jgi:hypothetical protein
MRVVERHVPQPDGRESRLIDFLSYTRMVGQGWARRFGVAFQRRNETERQVPGAEYSCKASMAGKLVRQSCVGLFKAHLYLVDSIEHFINARQQRLNDYKEEIHQEK